MLHRTFIGQFDEALAHRGSGRGRSKPKPRGQRRTVTLGTLAMHRHTYVGHW
jgi:hypothetical protein